MVNLTEMTVEQAASALAERAVQAKTAASRPEAPLLTALGSRLLRTKSAAFDWNAALEQAKDVVRQAPPEAVGGVLGALTGGGIGAVTGLKRKRPLRSALSGALAGGLAGAGGGLLYRGLQHAAPAATASPHVVFKGPDGKPVKVTVAEGMKDPAFAQWAETKGLPPTEASYLRYATDRGWPDDVGDAVRKGIGYTSDVARSVMPGLAIGGGVAAFNKGLSMPSLQLGNLPGRIVGGVGKGLEAGSNLVSGELSRYFARPGTALGPGLVGRLGTKLKDFGPQIGGWGAIDPATSRNPQLLRDGLQAFRARPGTEAAHKSVIDYLTNTDAGGKILNESARTGTRLWAPVGPNGQRVVLPETVAREAMRAGVPKGHTTYRRPFFGDTTVPVPGAKPGVGKAVGRGLTRGLGPIAAGGILNFLINQMQTPSGQPAHVADHVARYGRPIGPGELTGAPR